MKIITQDRMIWDISPLLIDPYADLCYIKLLRLHPTLPYGKVRLHHNFKTLTKTLLY